MKGKYDRNATRLFTALYFLCFSSIVERGERAASELDCQHRARGARGWEAEAKKNGGPLFFFRLLPTPRRLARFFSALKNREAVV